MVTDVARSLQWSPDIRYLAGRVISGMQNASITQFNALHLRVEKDARDWSAIMGGAQVRGSVPFSRLLYDMQCDHRMFDMLAV